MGRRTARAGLLALCLPLVLGAVVLAASARARPDAPVGVTAVDARTGRTLPGDPMLPVGSRVVVTVTGFAASAEVTVGLAGTGRLATMNADGTGTATYRYTVPSSVGSGRHELVFSGLGRPGRGQSPPGTVRATVPLVRTWPFRTPGRPSPGPSTGPSSTPGGGNGHGAHGAGAGSGSGAGHEPTALTGIDVAGLLAGAALALVGGGAVLRAAQRRRPG